MKKIIVGLCSGMFVLFLMLQVNVLADFQLLNDDFESGNFNNWTPTTANNSTWSIESEGSNKVLKGTVGAYNLNASIRTKNAIGANYSAEADISFSGQSYPFTLSARYQDPNNKYDFCFWNYGNQALFIDKYVNGQKTHIKEVACNLDMSISHRFKAVVNGSSLKFYVDGTSYIEVTDNSLTNGEVAISNFGSNIEIDNVVINEICQDAQAEPIEFIEGKAYDSSNNEIKNGTANIAGDITINARLLKRTSTINNATLLAALYDNNDQLININQVPISFSGTEPTSVNAVLTSPHEIKNCKIKTFVWDNINTMTPLRSIVQNVSFTSIPSEEQRGYYYGVNDDPEQYTDYIAHADEIIASGVKWIRISPEWGMIETSKGVYNHDFLVKLDECINKFQANNVNIDFVLCYTAPWASSRPADANPKIWCPADWTNWESYVQFVTNRYKGKVKAWEVWNNEDQTTNWKDTTANFKTMLQKAYNKIKTADVTNTVVLGGMSDTGNTWFDTLISNGAADYFDVIAWQSYKSSKSMDTAYNNMMTVVNKYSSSLNHKKMWITSDILQVAMPAWKQIKRIIQTKHLLYSKDTQILKEYFIHVLEISQRVI